MEVGRWRVREEDEADKVLGGPAATPWTPSAVNCVLEGDEDGGEEEGGYCDAGVETGTAPRAGAAGRVLGLGRSSG